jgi:hypothetical protein
VKETKGNEQLKRRFSSREHIQPFSWQTPKDVEEFRQLLRRIDDELPLFKDSHLAQSTTAFLIYSATGGVINYVMKLLRRAATLAVEVGSEQIDHSILAQAYEERLAQDFKNRPNPFHPQVNSHQSTIPSIRESSGIGATSKRVKPRQRKPSMSELLSHR